MTRAVIRYAAIGASAVVGIVALLHAPAARPLLARLGVRCPVDAVSPAVVEHMHRAAVRGLQGQSPAPTRVVFGLDLATSREEHVRRWIGDRGLACRATVRGLRYLSCANVRPDASNAAESGSAIQDLTFSFDEAGALVGIDALRGGLTGPTAAAVATAVEARLRRDLGAPTGRVGTFGTFGREPKPFETSSVSYRFSNALVTLTAVALPDRGVTVREQYVPVPAGGVS